MFSSKAAGWIAIVATVCMVLVILFQVLEIAHYGGSPSVWPTP